MCVRALPLNFKDFQIFWFGFVDRSQFIVERLLRKYDFSQKSLKNKFKGPKIETLFIFIGKFWVETGIFLFEYLNCYR